MKLNSINISTNYRRGYGRDDPKLITGSIEVRLGTGSWNTTDHTLTPAALEKICAIALQDFKDNNALSEIPDVLFFDEADLPLEPEPEPEPAPEPLTIETENGDKVALRPIT